MRRRVHFGSRINNIAYYMSRDGLLEEYNLLLSFWQSFTLQGERVTSSFLKVEGIHSTCVPSSKRYLRRDI